MDISVTNNVKERQLIKPNPHKGYLVPPYIIPSPKMVVSDMKYDLKAVKDGLLGKANDHQLGKTNDVGLKLGGLAIAAYLSTKRPTLRGKLMEFIGLGTFLATMKFWPKLAISLPVRALYGFDPHQEYVDSFGRKKPLFQDPQYIPDLYPQKELDKIGDKLGIDRNAKNRNELIQEKMKSISIKANTIWMLTAGIASAIGTAILCSKIEKPLEKQLGKYNDKKAEELLNNYDSESEKRVKSANESMKKDLNAIFDEYKNKSLDESFVEKVVKRLSKNLDNATILGVTNDVRGIIEDTGNKKIVNIDVKDIESKFRPSLEQRNLSDKTITALIPSQQEIDKKIDELVPLVSVTEKDSEGKDVTKQVKAKPNNDMLLNIRMSIVDMFMNNANAQNPKLSEYKLKIIKSEASNIVNQLLRVSTKEQFNNQVKNKILKLGEIMSTLDAKSSILDEYAQMKVADKEDSTLARYWNEVAPGIVKALGIDFKNMEKNRCNRELIQQMLRDKLEEITSDDAKYTKVFGEISKLVAQLDSKVSQKSVNKYNELVGKIFDEAAIATGENNFGNTSTKLTECSNGTAGSLKRAKIKYFEERVAGVRNSFLRFLSTMDVYRRISKGNLSAALTDGNKSREEKEAMIELIKQVTLQGHSADHSTKFYINRDSNVQISDKTDKSAVEIEKGKVKNKHFGKNNGVNILDDDMFYKNVMKYMYGSDLDNVTKYVLSGSNNNNSENANAANNTNDKKAKEQLEQQRLSQQLLQQLKDYNKNILTYLGGADDFTRPRHIIDYSGMSSEDKFILLGVAPDEMMTKTIQQMYNTNKWNRMFGAGR
ncbi:hypothetical protein IJG72_03935 [bacterium]|nr:hypothetical protein [bacterium]